METWILDELGLRFGTKDGLIYEYAGTSDSRIEAQWKSAVLTRNVNKISDTLWNYMTIHYSEDNSNGESYPTRNKLYWE